MSSTGVTYRMAPCLSCKGFPIGALHRVRSNAYSSFLSSLLQLPAGFNSDFCNHWFDNSSKILEDPRGTGAPVVLSFTLVQTVHRTLPSDLCLPTAEKHKERTTTWHIKERSPTDAASVWLGRTSLCWSPYLPWNILKRSTWEQKITAQAANPLSMGLTGQVGTDGMRPFLAWKDFSLCSATVHGLSSHSAT